MADKERIKINKPRGWRDGQTIFNFLQFLRFVKEYPAPTPNDRMADPFHIPDEELEKLYEEFLDAVKNPNKYA